MGWQKTFTLGRRSKGCHLVTNEVVSQIGPGLEGVQVSCRVMIASKRFCLAGDPAASPPSDTGRCDAITLMEVAEGE